MAHIPYVDDAIYQERLGTPQVANLLRTLFHSPDWAEAFVRLAGAQMSALILPPFDRELVILQTGYMLEAGYVVAQHEGIAEILGVSAAQRDALRSRRFADEHFTPRYKALLALVATLVDRTFPNEHALRAAREFYSDAELVEIAGIQGFAATVAGITRTFDVDIDPVSAQDLLRFSRAVAGS